MESFKVQRKSTAMPCPDVVADTRLRRVIEATAGETFPAYRQVCCFQHDPLPEPRQGGQGKMQTH